MNSQLEKRLINNGKINFQELAKLIKGGDETQNYIEYDSALTILASKGLLYDSKNGSRPYFILATFTSPHLAPIDSKDNSYSFTSEGDANQFSEKVFGQLPGNEIFVLKMI